MKYHYGDPCIHCGVPHDEVLIGACDGDDSKSIPIGYKSLGVRWDGVEHYKIVMSNGTVVERWEHISMHSPYYHFGYKKSLTHPPKYMEKI